MLWYSYHAMIVLHQFSYHNTSCCFLLLHMTSYFFVLSVFLLCCSRYLMIFPVISDYVHTIIRLPIIIGLTVTIMWIMTIVIHPRQHEPSNFENGLLISVTFQYPIEKSIKWDELKPLKWRNLKNQTKKGLKWSESG